MRKKQAKKRALLPDPKFNDQLVTRFVNNLMLQGKKSTAFKVFYDAIDIVSNVCFSIPCLCSYGFVTFDTKMIVPK